jgi:Lar family restriction alleviation protein
MSRSKQVELKGCPFCGCAEVEVATDVFDNTHVDCGDCGAQFALNEFHTDYRSKSDVVTAWNTRAPSALPAGWKLVPVEPTEDMLDAVDDLEEGAGYSRIYRAMLSASPPSEPGVK